MEILRIKTKRKNGCELSYDLFHWTFQKKTAEITLIHAETLVVLSKKNVFFRNFTFHQVHATHTLCKK